MATYEAFEDDLDELNETSPSDSPSNLELSEKLREVDRKTREFVVEHPFGAVGIAVGVGYIIGRVVSRW